MTACSDLRDTSPAERKKNPRLGSRREEAILTPRKTRVKHPRIVAIEAAHGETIGDILRRLYEQEGLGIPQISRHLGLSTSTVYEWMQKAQIPARPLKGRRRPKATA